MLQTDLPQLATPPSATPHFKFLWYLFYLLWKWKWILMRPWRLCKSIIPPPPTGTWISKPFFWSTTTLGFVSVLGSTLTSPSFLGGLRLHLNHLIGSRMTNYDYQFGTLPFGIFWSNLDTWTLRHILGPILVIFDICHFLRIPGLFGYFQKMDALRKSKFSQWRSNRLGWFLI